MVKLHRFIPGAETVGRTIRNAWRYRRFLADYSAFRRLSRKVGRSEPTWSDRYPCLHDRTSHTRFDRHYIYHTAWAIRVLAEQAPTKHVDIASSLHFITSLSAFVPVEFYDYRPAELRLSNLSSGHADLLNLPFEARSISSLSCMHVVEHVGLGRYGDPLDPEGDQTAMSELQRVLAPGGSLLFVTPLGRPRVCFNAHRIYSYEQVLERFPELRVRQFALIPDRDEDGGLIIDADPSLVAQQECACGCFWLTRPG